MIDMLLVCYSKSSADVLKSRLMKIAGSSEHGTEHHDALSRTAKLVLAASEAKNTPKLKDNPGNRPALFSNHLIQKYGPQVMSIDGLLV